MRLYPMALCLLLSPGPAWADAASVCGQRGAEFEASIAEKMAGEWTLTWTKDVSTFAGTVMPTETLPPVMTVEITLENDVLNMRGDVFKRDFTVAWDAETVADFDEPIGESVYGGMIDADEVGDLFECPVEDTPYLNGKSVTDPARTGSKGPQTDLHLWVFSDRKMLGLSVAEIGQVTSRSMYVLTKDD